ncbi:hypothetical protein THAOC_30394 [Thalassiosira oceanica]|uniref:Uncharacterized protein n=1 Tax=Thalassiosira oceanica TaxID=159749 RepID=K0RBK0_THAOC|nr:hypothetical protein THAOC_30394 [Thalassiosira oceanica]|eukprot:EJK50575.1 hypothetical protein THAOC_30394 [Thalassiosira oceanica]
MSVSRSAVAVGALALTVGSSTTFAFNTGGRTAHAGATSQLSNSPYGDEYDEQVPQQKKGFFQTTSISSATRCGPHQALTLQIHFTIISQSFFEELDAFVDDATSRRLGNGAQYYGKRKSSFYGKDDSNRKRDKNVADNTEDYRGPSNAGYFQWVPDENGEMRPVTRLKNVNIERKSRM